jgi:hypothetical protein
MIGQLEIGEVTTDYKVRTHPSLLCRTWTTIPVMSLARSQSSFRDADANQDEAKSNRPQTGHARRQGATTWPHVRYDASDMSYF